MKREDLAPDDQLVWDRTRADPPGTPTPADDRRETRTAPASEPSTWEAVDLTDALAGLDVPRPRYLARTDGVALLYPGRVHWFQGEAESLKSWAAQTTAAAVLADDGNVLYVDFEDDDRGVVARFLSLGAKPDVLGDRSRFRYLRPDEALYDARGTALPGALALARHLEHDWQLGVIDGVTEAMTTEGLKMVDNTDIARWIRLLPRRVASRGPAVVCLDHVPKNRDAQGRYAIGGQHKLAGVTGATYKFETLKRLARATGTDPRSGRSKVTVEKDRPGWVRGRADANGLIAMFEATAWPDGGVTTRILPPDEARGAPEWQHLAGILDYLIAYDGAAKSRIEADVAGGTETIRVALAWLVRARWVEVRTVGRAFRHHVTDLGRAELASGGEAGS